MRSSKVAKRYARALMGLSSDHAQLEAWGSELERLARIVDSPEVATQLESPAVTHADRMEALGKIAERLDLSFPLRSFAVVVASHGRVREVAAMAETYAHMLDDLMGRARATLTFAYQPTDDDLARVVAGLEAIAHKKIIPTTKIDASLVGGVIAELEGKIYDGSLATRLADAERRLSG
ncbi:MAG: ATP synthase F1 subunit delta [Candidatus Binataceae bacterium]|jgi:F-type H+-transporting ATPase subunit delta